MSDDQRSLWVEDRYATRCFHCKKEFGLIRRRHHCRQCGQVFCANCLMSVPVPVTAATAGLMTVVFGVTPMDKVCFACEKQRKQPQARAIPVASGPPVRSTPALTVVVEDAPRSEEDTPKHVPQLSRAAGRSSNLSPVASPTGRRYPTFASSLTISAADNDMLLNTSFEAIRGGTDALQTEDLAGESPGSGGGWRHPESAKDLLLTVGIAEVPMTVVNSVSAFIASIVEDAKRNPIQKRLPPAPRRPRQYHAFPRAAFRTGEKCAEAGLFATSFLDTGNHQARTGILDVLESNCSRQLMKRVRMLLHDININGMPPHRSSGAGQHSPDAMLYDPTEALVSPFHPRDKFFCSPREFAGSPLPEALSPRSPLDSPSGSSSSPPLSVAIPPIDTKLWASIICDIAWKTVSQTIADGDAQIMSHVDIISCLGGGDISDIEFIPGVAIVQHIASKKMASRIDRPRILLLGGDVGTRTNLSTDFYEYTQTYPGSLEKFYQRLLMWKPTLILVEKSVHHFLQTKIAANSAMTLVTSVPRFLLERIARHCGGRIIDDLGMVSMAELTDPRLSPLGCCSSFQLVDVNNRPVLMLSGLPQQTFTTVILRGAPVEVLTAIRYVLYIATATAYHLALQTHYLVDFNGILAQMTDSPRKTGHDEDDDEDRAHRGGSVDQITSEAPSHSSLTSESPLCRSDDARFQLCPELLTMNMGVQFPESVFSVSRAESLLLRDNIIVNAIFLDPQTFSSSAARLVEKQASGMNSGAAAGDMQQTDDPFVVIPSASTSDIRKQRQVYDFYQSGDRTLLDFLLKRVVESANSTRIIVHGKKQLIVRTIVEVRDIFEESSPADMEQFYASARSQPDTASGGSPSPRMSEAPAVSISAVRVSEALSQLFLNTMKNSSMQRVPMCYTTCKECLRNPNNARSATTMPFPVSPHTLSLSFGSFLELSIYASENCISSCGHRLHDDFIRKFVLYPTDGTQVTVSFEVERLKLGEIAGPPKAMSEFQLILPDQQPPESPDTSSTIGGFFVSHSPSVTGPFGFGESFLPSRSSEEVYFADELAEIRSHIAELGAAIRMRQGLPQHLSISSAAGAQQQPLSPLTAQAPTQEAGNFRETKEDALLAALGEIRTTKGLNKFRQSTLLPAVDEFLSSINNPGLTGDRRAAVKRLLDTQKVRPGHLATNDKFCLRLNEPTNIISAVLTEMQEQELIVTDGPQHHRSLSRDANADDGGFQRMIGQAIRNVASQMMPNNNNAPATTSPAAATAGPPAAAVEDEGELTRTPQPSNINTPTSSRSLGTTPGTNTAFPAADADVFPETPAGQCGEGSSIVLGEELHQQQPSRSEATSHIGIGESDSNDFSGSVDRRRASCTENPMGVAMNGELGDQQLLLHHEQQQQQQQQQLQAPLEQVGNAEVPEANETIEFIAGSEGISNAFVRDNFTAEDEAIEVLLGKKKSAQTTFKYVFRDLVCGDEGLKQNLTVEVLFPHQFAALRFLYAKSSGGIDELLLSLSRCSRFKTDGGKTKSDFFVTGDKRYMLKQIKQRELKHFFAFGPSYFQHMARFFATDAGRSNPTNTSDNKPPGADGQGASRTQSVLVKIFGIFSIQLKKKRAALGGDIKYYMLMENLLCNRHVDLMYDLKGSQRNRTAAEGSTVMLDQDLVRENKRGQFFFCSEEDRSWVTDTLSADASLLASCDIMDYSLIVGVEHHSRREQLVVGIIDYLHPYTGAKILESNMKRGLDVVFGPAGGRDPTIIEPAQYRERFLRWMNAYFCDVPDKVSQIRRLASAQQKKEKKQGPERPHFHF
jgi:hypothetical protein